MEAQTTTDSSDVVFRVLGWLHENRKPVIAGVAVAAVLGIAAGLYSWKQGQNDIDANAKLLSMPIGNDFRIQSSADSLEKLAGDYPSTSAGEYAALLAGSGEDQLVAVGGDRDVHLEFDVIRQRDLET